jgi:hypothetical protein
MQNRFYNNDRSIDNQSKIQCTELIRFPLTPKRFIIQMAKSIAKELRMPPKSGSEIPKKKPVQKQQLKHLP